MLAEVVEADLAALLSVQDVRLVERFEQAGLGEASQGLGEARADMRPPRLGHRLDKVAKAPGLGLGERHELAAAGAAAGAARDRAPFGLDHVERQ